MSRITAWPPCLLFRLSTCSAAVNPYVQPVDELTGVFPFGLPAGRCEPRPATPAAAFVLGVYPSALHVRWTAPPGYTGVRALAVAPEPWPFWDGTDEASRVAQWRADVQWKAEWGEVSPAGRVNGSSGQLVRDRVLAPLGLTLDDAWLSDALPFFFVHRGDGTQGSAMSSRYDPFATAHGLQPHRLPDRPSAARLVQMAVDQESERLRTEVQQAAAPLLISLGNEALAVAAALLEGDLPARLSPGETYGSRVQARLGRQSMDVLPLVHPGQRGETWRAAHDRWIKK